jgi:hypothetical protein
MIVGSNPTGCSMDIQTTNLINTIREFVETGMDQWEIFSVETNDGLVYVTISREPLVGTKDQYPNPGRTL